jgi:hypothetical protein
LAKVLQQPHFKTVKDVRKFSNIIIIQKNFETLFSQALSQENKADLLKNRQQFESALVVLGATKEAIINMWNKMVKIFTTSLEKCEP